MIKSKQKFIFILLFFYTKIITAQFPDDTYYQTISTETVPALPPFTGSIIDNTVPDPIMITRITEYNSDWNWYPVHDYAKIQAWNADASMYKFSSAAIYDATTYQIIKTLPGSDLYPSYWSNTNPDIMYSFRENGEIKSYSVSNNSFQTLYQLQNYDLVKPGPGEGNIDKNDHYIALVGKKNTDLDVIVFDLQTKQTVYTKTFVGVWENGNSVPKYIDWVSISQSGNYVGIMWNHNTTSESNPFNGHYGVEIYNSSDMQFLRRIAAYGNHGDFGFTPSGEEIFVQFWGETGMINAYYLDRTEHFVLQYDSDFGGEGHISCRNLNRPGWAYVSIDEPSYGIIVAVKTDSSQTVEYFGHHYSSSASYLKTPMPVPSPNGDKVMFKSDFGNATNADEVYDFEAQKINQSDITNFISNSVRVFPNPANNLIYIESSEAINDIKVYDTVGHQVINISCFNSNKIQLPVKNLAESIYFIKITDIHKQITVKKIIINIK